MNPVSRITVEGRAEFLRTWGPAFDQERGVGGSICAWKLYILKCDGFVRNAPVYHVYPVSRTTSEGRVEAYVAVSTTD